MKRIRLPIIFLGYVAAAFAITAGPKVVEFNEVSFTGRGGPFPLLTGSTDFALYGLTFEDSAHLVRDSRFTSAGTDDMGVATTQCPAGSECAETNPTPNMTFVFSDGTSDYRGARSATFFWIATGPSGGFTSNVIATWYDEQGNKAFTFQSPQPTPAAGFISGQFSSPFRAGTIIKKVTFTGNDFGSVGVGRVEFDASALSEGGPLGIRSPDLAPVQILCPATAGASVTVSICNHGNVNAVASTTRISSSTYAGLFGPTVSTTMVETPAIAAGGCASISVVPSACRTGRCDITATVNAGSPPISEANPADNVLSESCVIPPRP
jgi:hypothetical protein